MDSRRKGFWKGSHMLVVVVAVVVVLQERYRSWMNATYQHRVS
jgi:hypothetical protein